MADEATQLTTAEIISLKRRILALGDDEVALLREIIKAHVKQRADTDDLRRTVTRYGVIAVLGVVFSIIGLGVKAWADQYLK